MSLTIRSRYTLAAGVLALAMIAAPAQANDDTVCTADQVVPGFGFLPITFSPGVAWLLGVDPDECVTPVEG